MKLYVTVILSILSFSLYALEDLDRQELQQRIEPVGKVRVEQNAINPAQTTQAVSPVAEKKESGQAIYEQYCVACHRDGVAGAPKFRSDDWKPRLAGRSLDDLVASATKGLNAMPPKGTCAECSDDDLKAAIQYMLPKS